MFSRIALFLTLLLAAAVAHGYEATGGGDIKFTPLNANPVFFSHDYHLKLKGLKCLACHFGSFTMGSGTYKIKKEKLNKRDFCGHCHSGMKAFDQNETTHCSRCHKR